MTYEPVSFRGFGDGLNLRDKEDAVSETEAIDLLNVEFSTRGAVSQRNGYATFTSPALTTNVGSLESFYTIGVANQLLAGCGTRLEAINTAGAVVASATALTSGTWDFARFGAPGAEYAYAGQGNNTLRRWDGAAWTAPASMPAGGALAVMAVDQGNRLVCGRFNTTTGGPTGGASTSNPSRVHFSDAGLPETWGTNNYIDFTPGDGEKVQGIIAWRELLFIFKETKFFVVYGTSIDAAGAPVFNYRTVAANAGLASPRALCATEDGVYFMDRRGVYRTTGGEPQPVSGAIDPIFLGGASGYYLGGVLLHSQIANSAMWTHEQRIYLAITTTGTTNNLMLVYDPRFGWWSLYDIAATCGASFRIASQAELVFGYPATNDIGRSSSSYTSDAGTAITSRWRSGWFDYDLSYQKTIRESKLWGTGRVYLAVGNDFALETGNLTQLDFADPTSSTWGGTTWGGSTWATPAGLNPQLRRHAVRGTAFSTYLFNNTLDQPWSVHRLTHHLREQRIPSKVNV